MPLKDDLKALIIKNGWTITAVVEELNIRHSTNNRVQNFCSKKIRGKLKYSEVEEVLDILGYDITWTKRG